MRDLSYAAVLTIAAGWLWALPCVAAQDLRERLTEREDENRVEEPYKVPLLGGEVALTGQYEITLETLEAVVGRSDEDRVLLEHELELEAFYAAVGGWSFFAQVRLGMREDLLSETNDRLSDSFIERGEMWVIRENLFWEGFHVEVGRLEFQDDRSWWWDEDLDAIRLTYERDPFEISVAFAHELAAAEVDNRLIDPEEEGRVRLLVEATLDWHEAHAFEFFLVADADRSGNRRVGEVARARRLDEVDASLLWLGPRLIGGLELGWGGQLGYWADLSIVRGHERLIEFEPRPQGGGEVSSVSRRDVSGWGLDLGVTWFLPLRAQPRISLGWAQGSGSAEDDRTDRSFRQTSLHANEMGFGGVQRFALYGRLLDPELANLRILTLGLGASLGEASSVDLAYHHYRLVHRRDELREANIETAFSGRSRDVGQALDLIVALEDHPRAQFELSASLFRAGRAFGERRGRWAIGAFVGMTVAF